ncbi:hypothetical protein I2W78_25780 [Streptomyces spinoverrucosus]|uniref:hypothetical protein n=1 Tax=Streptomyces spinoverrucosus TaxID=284043 RepID=UPI0018C4374F|nr:hypothetical protein [Streptomyces spinoverrucosus]MBG0855162.1 hypothetical protein [Streptomyces spinoverrucosus]
MRNSLGSLLRRATVGVLAPATIWTPGGARAGARVPSHASTLGHESDVFDLSTGFRSNDNQSAFRLVSHRDAAWAGVLFVAADIRP